MQRIPTSDAEANVLVYREMEKPLQAILRSYVRRNTRRMLDLITRILTAAGYDGTNRNTVMIRQADPLTVKALAELAEKLPEEDKKRMLTKLYGQIGSGSLTVRKAVDNVTRYGARVDADRLYVEGRKVLRETAAEGCMRAEFMVQKSVGIGWRMETPGIREVDAFLKKDWSEYTAKHYLAPMGDVVRQQVEESLLLGESPQKMAKRIDAVEHIGDIRAKRNARTITTAVANHAQIQQYKKDGVERYEFVATYDERTCPVCGDLHGKRFDVGDAVEGTNCPPIHPNCRCTTKAVLSERLENHISHILELYKDDPRSKYIPPGMTVSEWQEQHGVKKRKR